MVRSISQKIYVILSGKAREGGDVNQSSLVRIFLIYYACLFDYQTTNLKLSAAMCDGNSSMIV